MKITPLQQALCADRSQITGGPNPNDWITPTLPLGWNLVSFHFLVDWSVNPPILNERIWMTRQVEFQDHELPSDVLSCDLLKIFLAGTEPQYFTQLNSVCKNHGHRLAAMLLPDIPVESIHDETPAWAIYLDKSNSLDIWDLTILDLKTVIRRRTGRDFPVGEKGLTYGTSSVECVLSNTYAAFPGDVDAVITDNHGLVRYVVEFKKHTINEPIGNHLINRYYPAKDGPKYRRLSALVSHYRTYNADVQLVVFYYSTAKPEMRLQIIDVPIGRSAIILKDSNDFNVSGLTEHQIATKITNWLGITP